MSRGPRPRDLLGRPLPREAAVPVEPDPQARPPAQTIAAAQDLLDAGRAFRAHEVFEALWKAVPTDDTERDLWRGLAQLAVGITHAQRGNTRGSASLLRRAAATLEPWHGRRPHGLAVDELRAWAGRAAEAIAGGELLSAPPPLTHQP